MKTNNSILVTAPEIAKDLGISTTSAYKLIHKWNAELEAKNYTTISGKVSRRYYYERIYGMERPGRQRGGDVMPAYKDTNGTYFVSFYYEDFRGVKKRKMKRGFARRRDALDWERRFLLQSTADLSMKFSDFVEIYRNDKQMRIRESTWESKNNMIDLKILPYFKDRPINAIEPKDIIAWQNEIMNLKKSNGEPYSTTYLKSIHSQLSAIFNHAVRYYRLQKNPAEIVGNMGKDSHKEMLFWTKDEYLKFAKVVMDKPTSYYAFEVLYWCGIRLGELLALTASDFNFERQTLTINKSLQNIKGNIIITPPKTPKSNRTIKIPQFLVDEMQDYIKSLYGLEPDDRIFPISKAYLHHEMNRGAKAAGVKRIRIHDLRHSHVSLLIEMGFSAVAIAERVGHESIDITYRYAHLFPTKQTEMANRLNSEWTKEEDKPCPEK